MLSRIPLELEKLVPNQRSPRYMLSRAHVGLCGLLFLLVSCASSGRVSNYGIEPDIGEGVDSVSKFFGYDLLASAKMIDLSLCPSSCLAPEATYNLIRGDLAYNNKNHEQALNFYKAYLSIAPDSVDVIKERLVELYLINDNLKEALNFLESSNVSKPPLLYALMSVFIQIGLGENDNALRELRDKVFVISENEPVEHRNALYALEGALLISLGKYAEAVSTLSRYSDTPQSSILGLCYLGDALWLNGELDKAESLFKIALSNPNTGVSKTEGIVSLVPCSSDSIKRVSSIELKKLPLGYLLYLAAESVKNQELLGARRILSIVTSAIPDDSQARYALASVLLGLRDIEAAISEFLKIKPEQLFFEDSRALVAYLFQSEQDYERSVIVAKELLSQRPEHPPYLNLLASMYMQASKKRDAVDIMEKLVQLSPNDAKLLFSTAVLYDEIGEKQKCVNYMERALEINPNNANTLNYLAYSYAEAGTNLPKAARLIKKALSIEGENSYYVDTLGWVYYKMNKLNIAIKEIRRALDLSPNDAVILEHLAKVQLAIGKKKEAKETLRRVVENSLNSEDKQVGDRARMLLQSL